MTRPLTRAERAAMNRHEFMIREEEKAREKRGDKGAMEIWFRNAYMVISQEAKAGRTDVYAAYALVNRLFVAAVRKRAAGDRRLWDDLLRYAQAVVDREPRH